MALTCKNCGGNIIYNRQNKIIYCDSCGYTYNLLNTTPQDSSVLENLNISKNELSVYQQAVQCMEKAIDKDDWETAVEMLSLIPNVLDAQKLQQMCLEQVEMCKGKELFSEACRLAETNDIYALKRAVELFSQNPEWENSQKNLTLCNEKILKLEKAYAAEQRANERLRKLKKTVRTIILSIISVAIVFLLICFIYYQNQKYNINNIKINVVSMESNYHPNESPYINGCYYIYFDYTIKNNTYAVMDYIVITTQLKDKSGKLIYQISSSFGGYGDSSLQLEKGQEITLETYVKENKPNESFSNVFGTELSEYDISISIKTVRFGDGHYYNK